MLAAPLAWHSDRLRLTGWFWPGIPATPGDGTGKPFQPPVRAPPRTSGEQAATQLYIAMCQRSTDAYRAVITGPDADERIDLLGAHLIGAHLLGVTFSRYVGTNGPLARMAPDAVVRHLTRTRRDILFGPS
ncbi:hypothetical protein [Streptomyces sp. NPDC001502]|uniref:TetR/AcrR family transcriptional regulator n=1 Tax=Streptomyces sp. NPDC001502 TaxID=3364578 RepID=UPI0036756433